MKKLIFALLALTLMYSCNRTVNEYNRDNNIKQTISKFVKTKDSVRVDSVILIKVTTLDNKTNTLTEAYDWAAYTDKRKTMDSLDIVMFKTNVSLHKAYQDLNIQNNESYDGEIKEIAKKLIGRNQRSKAYLEKSQSLFSKASSMKADKSDLGYYVNFRIVYTDKMNLENRYVGFIRLSHNYSIIKTDIPGLSEYN